MIRSRFLSPKAVLVDEPGLGLVAATALAGIALRVWLAWGPYGNYDQTSYQMVAEILSRGGNVFVETQRYNYSPLWAYVLVPLFDVARSTGLAFHFVVRSFLTIADLGNAAMIGLLTRRTIGRAWRLATITYLLNPVIIMIVGYHGQFDNLAALPLLVACYLAVGPRRPWRLLSIWALATLGLLTKHLCVFSVWMLLVLASPSLGQAVILFGASLAVFLLSFSPFLPAGLHGIVGNVFLYAGITRPYGLSAVLPKGLLYPIFIASMGVLPVVAKRLRLSLPRAMELAAVLLLVLIPGSGEAYFIIPAIWGSVRRSRGFWLFTVVTYVFLLSGPNNLQALTIAQPWNLVWFTLVFWVADFGWDWHRERAMAT